MGILLVACVASVKNTSVARWCEIVNEILKRQLHIRPLIYYLFWFIRTELSLTGFFFSHQTKQNEVKEHTYIRRKNSINSRMNTFLKNLTDSYYKKWIHLGFTFDKKQKLNYFVEKLDVDQGGCFFGQN